MSQYYKYYENKTTSKNALLQPLCVVGGNNYINYNVVRVDHSCGKFDIRSSL